MGLPAFLAEFDFGAIYVSFFIGVAIVLLYLTYQKWDQIAREQSQTTVNQEESTIAIEFDTDTCFREIEVPADIGIDLAAKRLWWFYIKAKKHIENVGVEVDKKEVLPNRPDDTTPTIQTQNKYRTRLKFEGYAGPRINFSENQRVKIEFLERTTGIPDPNSEPIIFCNTPDSFYPGRYEHHIHIRVTAKGIRPCYKVLSVWIDRGNNLRVDLPKVRLVGPAS